MSKYQQFIFESYYFNPLTGQLDLYYAIDDAYHFTETYQFHFGFVDYDPAVLDRAIQNLFFIAGVSYYKTYVPAEIVIKQGGLDAEAAAFFSKTYQRGLGEFWYVNQLDPETPVNFPVSPLSTTAATAHNDNGLLIGLGGGKDSLVSVELLRQQVPVTTWSLNHRSQLEPLVDVVGLPHLWVERTWDPQLSTLPDAINGHVPISAIFACAGVVTAVLSGKRDVVVSNEQSANEATLLYRGSSINHQYSKSQEFEQDFQNLLTRCFGDSIRYYSLLRSYSELRIAELFSRLGFGKYKGVFSSCNRAFTHDSDHMFWCGHCPKCAFVFLALTPFIQRGDLESLWGKNLLLEPALEPTYRQLLGIAGDKPLECVGEIKESRAAMRMAQDIYPTLQDLYKFELPAAYDFRKEYSNELPSDIQTLLDANLRCPDDILK